MPDNLPYDPDTDTLKDLKLNTLLEVTKAINENHSKDRLLALYQYVLKDQLGVERLVLFNNYGGWQQFLKFGVRSDVNRIDVAEDLLKIQRITLIDSSTKPILDQFEIIIPVFHKAHPLAYVLLGGTHGKALSSGTDNGEVEHLNFIQTLTNLITVAIENKRLAKEAIRQERVKKELELASEVQSSMIPRELPCNDRVEMAGYYQPHQQVGGDYYDLIRFDDEGFVFCMADVSGKGVSAALLMSNFQANVRALLQYTDHSLEEVIRELHDKVNESTGGHRFITFFIGHYRFKDRVLEYINAGHNPPLVHHREHGTRWLKDGCPGLGMLDELPFVKKGREELAPGDLLVCYTDGIVELEGEEDGLTGTDRLEKLVEEHRDDEVDGLNHTIIDKLGKVLKGRPYRDDTALFSFRIL